MNNKDLIITVDVDQPAGEVFNAVCNVSKWWTEDIEGGTKALNDEFTVRFEDVHYSKQKLIEVVPNKKIVWLITDSKLSFLQNQQEWTDTRIVFDISQHKDKTRLQFTHAGLVPDIECYKDCSNAWGYYISGSLAKLISSGKGQPEKIKA
ncbi:MAG TPA: SRPBCC domain-containing protein [Puia sp.]|nr:SRPBCC domain-containing protein [Puia sp.]